jgi:eukaryotic-like serine/threonine-protein kinase
MSNTRPHMQSDPDEALAPGDRIGRYQLTALLASGGMGQVWTARPIGSGFARTVALKLIRAEVADDENYARMFIDEATVASSIHHPNVCETYELGKDGERMFMAMEWVAGDSLAGLLRQGDTLRALDLRIAARIIADACAGLHAAHETLGEDGAPLGVVHRDISPPNILVSMQGQTKVNDFGIAKARYQLHERTKTGEVKGKFAYIPPEQISGGQVDRRADVYAMGCVLYVATLGSRPFGNGANALRKILLNEYKLPRALRPDYPEGLEAVIVRALSPKPDARYQTAEEMQVALEEWLLSSGKLVTASEVARCVKERINPDVKARNDALLSQNRMAPELLMSRLASERDNETPTAGSGLTQAPAALWRGKPMTPAAGAPAPSNPIQELKDVDIVELTPTRLRAAPSQEERRRSTQPPTRPSDATGLVDFVPHGGQRPSVKAPSNASSRLPSEPAPAERSSSARHVLLSVLLFVVLIVSLLLAARLLAP